MFGHDQDFDFGDLLSNLRCHTNEWLEKRREWLVREQRRLHVEELAVWRVLDERGQVDESLAQADGVSVRSVRDTVATARALEVLPAIASVAASGALSSDQLTQVVRVADASDDHIWAAEAPAWSPRDLADRARAMRKPTIVDGAARREARELRYWPRRDAGMVDGRFSLADVDGVFVSSVFDQMIDEMRPTKGHAWATREHRGADALVELCRFYAAQRGDGTSSAPAPHLIVHVPLHGPATVAGIPLPDAMVERLRAQAKVEPVLVADDGEPITVGRVESVLSEKTKRVVRQRDGKCRWPGCDQRAGLEVHHLWPRSWDGSDELWNLASVCWNHHHQLAPQGSWLLLGNPNNPAGLSLIAREDLPKLATLAAEHARAGPSAA